MDITSHPQAATVLRNMSDQNRELLAVRLKQTNPDFAHRTLPQIRRWLKNYAANH